METKAELQAKIRVLEELEKNNELNQRLLTAQELIGKCKSTHTFTRKIGYQKTPNFNGTIERVDNVYLKNDQLCYAKTTVHISTDKDGNFNFQVQKYPDCGEAFSGYYSFKYDMNPTAFENALKYAEAQVQITLDTFRSTLNQVEWITQGDHGVMSSHLKLLKEAKVELLTIRDKDIKDYLSWYHHPFYWEDQLMLGEATKQILRHIINTLRDEARTWGGSIVERDYPRAQKLENFLNTLP